MSAVLFGLFAFALVVGTFYVQVIGTIHCFRKAWYVGLAALVFPIFAFVVGTAKLLGKDILA